MRSPRGIWGYLLCSKIHGVSTWAVPLCFFSSHHSYSEFDIKCNCLFALDSAVDLTSFQETSPFEMMTAFVLKFFLRIGMEISKQKSKPKKKKKRNGKSTKKRDLLRTWDLFHDLLTLAGYVEVLVIPTGARRIKVVEEKPAHSYLGNLGYRHRAHPRTSRSLPWEFNSDEDVNLFLVICVDFLGNTFCHIK